MTSPAPAERRRAHEGSGPGILLSAEHAGNRVPEPYLEWFSEAEEALVSHRGWDIGADGVLSRLAPLAAAVHRVDVSRLLVDANRSFGHPRLFSEWSRRMPDGLRRAAVEETWRPHRAAVERDARRLREERGSVLHISVHSFTPVLDGDVRDVDIGLLYDPGRKAEATFARCWRRSLQRRFPSLRVRMNRPYAGRSDGLTTALRARLGARYLGIELEVNQALVPGAAWALSAFPAPPPTGSSREDPSAGISEAFGRALEEYRGLVAPGPELVVLAAGLGSRFGGAKQLATVGPEGETLPEIAIAQAAAAGFGSAVVVTRAELAAALRRRIAASPPPVPTRIALQRVPEGRSGPPGTGHAVLSAYRDRPPPPCGFAVCNADDIYGRSAFRGLRESFAAVRARSSEGTEAGGAAGASSEGTAVQPLARLVTYRLDRTLSPSGGVNRALCRVRPDGSLASIEELLDLRRREGGGAGAPIHGRRLDGASIALPGDAPVSMNLWGFDAEVLDMLSAAWRRAAPALAASTSTEFLLSSAVGEMVAAGDLRVEVVPTEARWAGVTHPEDIHRVREFLAEEGGPG